MGRTFASLLKHTDVPEGPAHKRPAPSTEPAGPSPSSPIEGDVPFIEIGPRRSIEGSPDVMASVRAARPAAAPPGPPSVPVESKAPTTVVLRPVEPGPARGVAFRPLPVRRHHLAPELVAYHVPEHVASAAYRNLLDRLVATVPGVERPALLFTAVRAGIGTTTALLNVAICAAQQGLRVVVIDANLPSAKVAERLGLAPAPGLREVLAGTVTLDQALQTTEQKGLMALTAGVASGLAAGGEAVHALLRQAQQGCDLVLVDGPFWDGGSDVTLLGTACDAAYLVVPAAEAEAGPVNDLLASIPAAGTRLVGCVVVGR